MSQIKGEGIGQDALLARMGDAGLMSTATTANQTVATLRSADGRHFGRCQLASVPDNGIKNALSVYPTAVLPSRPVTGACS